MRNYTNPSSNLVNTLPDNMEIPCGKGSKLTKVIGGMEATPGEYPWAAYLVIGKKTVEFGSWSELQLWRNLMPIETEQLFKDLFLGYLE